MNCGYCNYEVRDDENYCSQCGAPILDFISYPNDLYYNMAIDLFNIRIRCGDCGTLFWLRYPGINVCPFCKGEQLVEVNAYPINEIEKLEDLELYNIYMTKVEKCRAQGKVYQ